MIRIARYVRRVFNYNSVALSTNTIWWSIVVFERFVASSSFTFNLNVVWFCQLNDVRRRCIHIRNIHWNDGMGIINNCFSWQITNSHFYVETRQKTKKCFGSIVTSEFHTVSDMHANVVRCTIVMMMRPFSHRCKTVLFSHFVITSYQDGRELMRVKQFKWHFHLYFTATNPTDVAWTSIIESIFIYSSLESVNLWSVMTWSSYNLI